MIRVLVVCLICLLSSPALAQKEEISFHARNGILLNKKDVKSTFGNRTVTDVMNTLTQSVGGSYSRHIKKNIWLSAGLDIGYEHYKANVAFPFEEYGYVRDPILSAHYTHYAYIPFTDVRLEIGYRKRMKKIQPEVSIGQIVHFPLREKSIDVHSIARPANGHRGDNFVLGGWFGRKPGSTSTVEFINMVYIGAGIPSKMKNVSRVNLGLQLQKQLFGSHEQNYLSGTYNDGMNVKRSADVFRGTHTSASLVVGLVL